MHFLCGSDALGEAQSRGFHVQDFDGQAIDLLLVRRHGIVYAYRNRCPHRGVTLEWQPDRFLDDSASLIQCARHGALFLMESGECVAGPCAGDSLIALNCREDSQGIWLDGSEIE
ncbi:Rieske 2Fe-2S domain-containing protein [Pseudomonas sp. R5(2019)]|uniref:Rieske (2Fe-2S) protein n=1 Tax=Pseudomonas sp. R5(2019) TaxID=2697566 RepID=UPI0014136BE8|nr:Rieske 2Fe-2S domain-containing protein [Pseudomonas sp. R5(2019)]NBA98201.1 Rieske 2Fe-2S domain-containing protein [Pseudomonas sp. R5(2019)]